MNRLRVLPFARWAALLAFLGLASLTWLWFLLLAIDSFKMQEGSGLPRTDLALSAQIALGVGVLLAGTAFVWAGGALFGQDRARSSLAPAMALLVVAADAAILAAAAPTLIHPVHEVIEGGVDRSLEGAAPWVSYFWVVSGGALVCAALLLVFAAAGATRTTRGRSLSQSR